MSDLEDRLKAHLVARQAQHTQQAGDLLMAWLDSDDALRTGRLPPELEADIAQERARLALELATLLGDWLRLGGELRVDVPEVVQGRDEDCSPGEDLLHAEDEETEDCPAIGEPMAEDLVQDESLLPGLELDVQPHVAEPSRPHSPAAQPAQLEALKDRFEAGGPLPVGTPQPRWRDVVPRFLVVLGGSDDHMVELDRLESFLSLHLDELEAVPDDVQCLVLAVISARLRHLQECLPSEDRRLVRLIRQLGAYSQRVRPGFVHGLALEHRPRHGGWSDDADYWLKILEGEAPDPPASAERLLVEVSGLVREVEATTDAPARREAVIASLRRTLKKVLSQGLRSRDPRLVRLLTPLLDDLVGVEFRPLRRAIRRSLRADESALREEDSGSFLPVSWAWLQHTRGRRGAIVGGDPREHSRRRLQAAFEFRELRWIETREHVAGRLRALQERVRRGGVDVILMITRYSSHSADDLLSDLCKQHGVPLIHVHRGYGVTAVRQAIEQYLEPTPTVEALVH